MGEGEDSLEAGLRAVYRHRVEHESVLEALGVRSQVLLRDAPDDPTPVLRVSAKDAADDERYQVLGEIARGGIGVVLKSRDRDLARDVALKVLRKEYAENAEVLERFVEEAQIGGQLQHPGIVPVYGMGMQSDGRPHFAMKLVKGRTLSALLEERTDPARGRRRFLAIFEQVCLTVAYAHARGVIHRDLKPSNIMVGAFGEVQVVDWGFAKVLGTSAAPQRKPDQTMIATVRSDKEGSQSVAGSVMGTPAYMPPEQALGRVEELDERADVFALGAVLCEILTGQPPYVGKDLMILAAQGRLEDAFRRLAECGAEAEQIEFTKHCLAPASAERPKDAGAVATAIAAQLAAGEERAHKAELEAAEARAHEQEERARLAEQEVAAKEQEAHAAKAKRQAERARARQREERRRAESEHRRRLLVIAIAAVLLLAVAIGGGGYLISAGEEHARRERVEMAVSDALQKALELEGARELAQALVSAKAAADLARDADSATLSAAEEAAARIQAEIKRDVSARRKWERDRKLLDELRAVSLRSYDDWSRSQMDEKYVATFRRHGIDFEKQSVSRIARLVRQSSDPVELAAFLDEWAVSRRYWRLADWRTPLEASRLGDPDPVRNRMRAACASDDAVTLRRLMETADTAAMPVRSQALLGYIADSVGETAAAQAYLQRVRRRHPGNLWVNTALACTLINRRPEEAVRYLTAAQALRPGSAGGQAHLAIALAAAGNFAQADAMCRSLRERFPDSTYTCSALAYVRAERRDWRGTIEAAEQWRERKEQASVYQLLTVAHLKLLDLDAALAASREAVRIRSADLIGHVLNLCNLTIRLACNGEFDEAIASARRATELLPDRPHGWCAWCYPLTFQGKSDEAIEKLRRSLECDPEHVDANHCLGEILMRWKGAWEEAHAHIQAALKVEPRNPAALDSLADCYRYRGDLDRAIQATEQALRTDPKCAAAWITRARCYLDLGDLAQADECANNALRIDSGRARAYYVLGEVHARQGNHEDAIAAFGEAIRRKTGHWFALYQRSLYALHLAQSLMHLGRYDEARESLRQAAVLDREPHTAPLTARERRDYEIAVKVCDAILALGDRKTPETREQTMALAHRAYHEGRFAEAVGHFKAIQPEFRYRATCAAARAGAQFRPQCLEWLQAELEDARRRADHDPIDVRLDLQAWKRARDLAGVRDPIPLAKLPDSERAGWVPFWRDVDALLARAREAQ